MPISEGYVGTIQVESVGDSRIWFGLTTEPQGGNWLRQGPQRAWFTLNFDEGSRVVDLATLNLLQQALNHGLAVRIGHEAASEDLKRVEPGDTFEVKSVRVLRQGLSF